MRRPPMPEHGCMKQIVPVLATVLAFLGSCCVSHAGTASASFKVSVRMLHSDRVEVLSEPPELEITGHDIARGYVEVMQPVVLSVATSSPSFTLVLARVGAHVRAVHVRGLPDDVRFTSDSVVVWPASARSEKLELRVVFQLAPGLEPGKYPWALRASNLAL